MAKCVYKRATYWCIKGSYRIYVQGGRWQRFLGGRFFTPHMWTRFLTRLGN